MKHDIDWSKSHCGVMLCSFEDTIKHMPEVEPILSELLGSGELELDPSDYAVDVKVHMLMPGQFPCIPGWHRDFIPRDESLKKNFKGITGERMYMWISSAPLTLYRDGGKVFSKPAQEWHSFTRMDLHRGAKAEAHVWRCFIRVIPRSFIHGTTTNVGTRRIHTQVYLDANGFTW